MRRRQGLLGILIVVIVLVAGKIGLQTYRWYVHDEERARIQALSSELEDVAVEVVGTQLVSDSLRAVIEGMDEDLEGRRVRIAEYERHAVNGALPVHLYDGYRRELELHNRLVVERNSGYEMWHDAVSRNHAAVERYNALVDSIRSTAAEMGEPYFTIPTPAEIAVERGISPRG